MTVLGQPVDDRTLGPLPVEVGRHRHDRQVEGPGELPIPLVLVGNGHDGAGAVIQHDVVRDEDRNASTGDGVDCERADEDAGLLPPDRLTLDVRLQRRGAPVRRRRFDRGGVAARPAWVRAGRPLSSGQRVDRGMLRGQHEVRRSEDGVRPGGEHANRFPANAEVDVRAIGAADPVALHREHVVGPGPFEPRHVVQQPLRVRRGSEEPLKQLTLDDRAATPLTPAGDHLLVGQHRLVGRAPVDVGDLPKRQPTLEQPQEQPLVPSVVLRIRRVQPGPPVEGDAQPPEGVGLHGDVLIGPLPGVQVAHQRRILGRKSERVPAYGIEDVRSTHAKVSGDAVADGVGLGVAHVQVARRVRVHADHVGAGTVVAVVAGQPGRLERASIVPHPHPPLDGDGCAVRMVRRGAHRRSPRMARMAGAADIRNRSG